MLKVTVELISAVDPSRSKPLGYIIIANDGTGDKNIGNYRATLMAEYTKNKEGKTVPREGKILNFNRKGQSVMSLVGAALKMFGHTKHSPKLLEKV